MSDKNKKNDDYLSNDEDTDDNLTSSNRSSIKNKQTGFKTIVKRIQLVARMSKVNQDEDCYHEDIKLNSYLNSTSKSIKRRSKKISSRQTSQNIGTASVESFDSFQNKFSIETKNKSYILGEIKFFKEDCKQELKPFISIEPRISANDIAHVLKDVWELDVPKIVTFVISSKSRKNYWNNKKQIKNFQIGIAKAAMSTNMWILTNGLNCGAASYICSAIEKESRTTKMKNFFKIHNFPLVFGISNESDLIYGNKMCNFDYPKSVVCVENVGFNDTKKFELNPHHSHFIILKNPANNKDSSDFMLKLIEMLIKRDEFTNFCNQEVPINPEIPLVSILIEGEPENSKLIMNLIKKQMPVVVFQGSGGLADIVAYAYTRIWAAFPGVAAWDPDYIEDYIKPLVAKKISLQFTELASNPIARNIIRDQVIECVRLSVQDDREYLVILDMHNPNSCNLKNLSEHLLKALLKSRRNQTSSTHDQILKDFDLIMDWNCADVAKSLLFTQNSFNITDLFKSKFFHVLVRDNREEFVEIFLSNGFQLHKFLTPSRLSRLFRVIHDDDFFHTVCWETALGQSSNSKQGKFFIESDLNWLIEFCTGLERFVNTEDLHLNALGIYSGIDSFSAERKALTLLSIWAVMQNRYKLVEVLWKYSDHPVHLALIISMFFERLSWHVLDTNLKSELKQKSKQFASYANGVLDRCYNENISLAYNVLRESIKDWNYMTAVDIAASAQLKQFLAHPCCQKWLTNMFQGKIRLREIAWGFFTIPISIKILLCSLFILPMYIWVRFKNEKVCEANLNTNELEEEFDVYENMYNNLDTRRANSSFDLRSTIPSSAMSAATITFSNNVSMSSLSGFTNKAFEDPEMHKPKHFINNHHREVFVKKQPPLWKMIKMMWCSPISKFYTSQLFYIVFLILISFSALYPNCGNLALDSIICIWTLLIAISYIRHTYILVIKYSSVSVYSKIVEIILILAFALIFGLTRVLHLHLYPVYGQKVIISLAVLYFYYRLISIYLPISPTLGPLLYRFRLMVTVDFVNYMRITLVILISNAIVIRALQFPYQDLTVNSVTSVIHQGILSLFNGPPSGDITIHTDLKKKEEYCGIKIDENLVQFNKSFVESSIIEESSLIIYIFVFQYYIILKLIVGPLLFSIFAVTASKWVTEIDSIWKFQRYHLVIDFANRLSIPEPLSLFYYVYCIFYYIVRTCSKSLQLNIFKSTNTIPTKCQNIISHEDCMYWKQLAAEYLDNERKKSEKSQIIYKEWDYIQEISEEIEYEKKILREIKGKIQELEKILQSKVITDNQEMFHSSAKSKDNECLSRLSPYPGTQIHRFPLPRKYISWHIAFFAYEPVCYTMDKNEFSSELQCFLDEDILKMKEECLRNKQNLAQIPSYKWNDQELNEKGIVVDRRSWKCLENDTEKQFELGQFECSSNTSMATSYISYKLEDNFLPINPYGRTGLCGKGCLARWGPNHCCILIIAHIDPNESLHRQTKLLLTNNDLNELRLIERYINNETEVFQLFTKLFDFGEQTIANKEDLQEALLRHFPETQIFLKLIKRGYLDDPCNTDNAWKEAIVYCLRLVGRPKPHLTSLDIDGLCLAYCEQNESMANMSLVHSRLIELASDTITSADLQSN